MIQKSDVSEIKGLLYTTIGFICTNDSNSNLQVLGCGLLLLGFIHMITMIVQTLKENK